MSEASVVATGTKRGTATGIELVKDKEPLSKHQRRSIAGTRKKNKERSTKVHLIRKTSDLL